MSYRIMGGTVSIGGYTILSHIDFEIKGDEEIAIVGRSEAGKATLLHLITGGLDLGGDDKRMGPGVQHSRRLTVEVLKRQTFTDVDRTMEEELLAACPCKDTFDKTRFEYEQRYNVLFTGFGLEKRNKRRKIDEFSNEEQTKIALVRLPLAKPGIPLLGELTNHLDMEASEQLGWYLKKYGKMVVKVPHDRFFLDRAVDAVYELTGEWLVRYPGNYSHYQEEKQKSIRLQAKTYERQQEKIKQLEDLVKRFKHEPKGAAFARFRKKAIEQMTRVEAPKANDVRLFTGQIRPLVPGNKWVLEAEHPKIEYDKPLLELSMRIRKGQKVGLLRTNGVGRIAFLKTIAGLAPPVAGGYSLGNTITIDYFDQHLAKTSSKKSAAEHFHDLFPILTGREVKGILGAYLFGGKDAGGTVNSLSGGEKARLALAELLQSRPSFLILGEPTNHTDTQARGTLESAFRAYQGAILFVSHGRYFIRQVANAILIFENQDVMYYPFGYEYYLERWERLASGESTPAQTKVEEQALVAGMRMVPEAGRRRLWEILTEGAYLDQRLRLAGEMLEPFEAKVEQLAKELETAERAWLESEVSWTNGSKDQGQGETRRQPCTEYENAWQGWHKRCMEWYDTIGEELV